MAIVEYEGKKYDTEFEFETMKDDASGIAGQCYGYKIWVKDLSEEERKYLVKLGREGAQLSQRFDLVDDIGKILELQKYLEKLRETLNEKFGDREMWNEPHYV